MNNLNFGIFHTAYERAKNYFFKLVNTDYVNTFLVESNYLSDDFKVSFDELKKHSDKDAFIAVTYLGFEIINNATTIADNGEVQSVFNPTATLRSDYKERIDSFINFLKENGYYEKTLGFYMDEPLLWNISNDDLETFTKYFHDTCVGKRFFICFSIAGVAPEFWTINNVQPITPKSTQYLTDIAFDMYHKWSNDYLEILKLMKERSGNRDDLHIWMIPCTMNYRGDKDENHCLEHLEKCYEVLKKEKCPGGLMCFTYYTFKVEEEALGNIGLDKLGDPTYKDYWPTLIKRIEEIGKEIINK